YVHRPGHGHRDFHYRDSAAGDCFHGKVRVVGRRNANRRNDSSLPNHRRCFVSIHRLSLRRERPLVRHISSASTAGSESPSRAIHAYSVGSKKILSKSAPTSPPTMTIANGRCESEPIPCDTAAGNNPSIATSIVIMMGRNRSTAPSIAASSIV